MALRDHEFGGVSTDLKLSVVERYLSAFTNALRGKFKELWYIDAFAGTGERTVKLGARDSDLFDAAQEEQIERHLSSARIAIETAPPFDRLIFMDKDPRHCEALRELRTGHPAPQIEILEGDPNSAIKKVVQRSSWKGITAVMFLDPYGMSVDWQTLESIRTTEAIDV